MKKQIISILLAVMLLCTVFPIAGFAVTMGDVNGDGKVQADDARWALRAAVELEILTKAQAFRADADFDGEVTPADSRLILRATVGLQDLIEREMPDFPDKDEPVTVTRPEQPTEQPSSPLSSPLSSSPRIRSSPLSNTPIWPAATSAASDTSIHMRLPKTATLSLTWTGTGISV